ncbi:MAG: diaminopimelate decarboxylase, partial [Angelakisella sp.]|nr:diaminopimelate decarboxylase [Angelakisella sp.]
MFVSPHLDINSLGHLTIGGEDTVELAERYGTPLYLMSEEELRDNCRQYRRSMEEFYGGRGLVAYA